MTSTHKQRAVAITGMGMISSTGEGVATFRDALLHGKSNFSRSSSYPILSFPVLGAFISDFNFSQALSAFINFAKERQETIKKIARSSPIPLQLALIAALEAWQQAAMDEIPVDATRIGLVIAAQNSTSHYQYNLYSAFQQQPDFLSPTYALHFMDTDHVGVLSEVFGILGEGFTVGGASACGNVALLRAYQLIQNGNVDACLVVGALADLSPMELQGFHNLGALGGHRFADQPNKACRPFDQAHEGFIYGQATACLMLESLSSVEKRESKSLAYLLGGALLLDGNRLSNPNREGEIRVMQQALKSANISSQEINYINTHGTSAPMGDQVELEAIEALLSGHSQPVMINATKSMTGHCLWSAGIVEAIASIIQMQDGFVHPTLNLENPITNKLQLIAEKSTAFDIKYALSNAFGFGGINTTIVLSKEI